MRQTPTATLNRSPRSRTTTPGGELRVTTLSREAHLAHLDAHGNAGFLQYPSWARVKDRWRNESIGWIDADGRVVGSALVLYRKMPKVPYWFAYLGDGPVIDWTDQNTERLLAPLIEHMRSRHVSTVRIGPPLAHRRWYAQTVKDAVKLGLGHLDRVTPDEVDPVGFAVARRLVDSGWRRVVDDPHAQPLFVFEIPLAGRALDDVAADFNQEWRRAITKAAKSGVDITLGSVADLPRFHELLKVTEERNGFCLGREPDYWERQFVALNEERPDRMRLYLAHHDKILLAAHTRICAGATSWYHTGASADENRRVRPGHALQWHMIRDAHEQGAAVHNMRAVDPVIDSGDRRFGVLRWKLGTGGRVVENLGEWEYPVLPNVDRVHRAYRALR